MSLLRGLLERLRALLSRTRLDAEIEDELRFHIEMETEKNLRKGMNPAEARRQAMIAFGGVERFREQTREEWGARPLEDLVVDLRFALRTLRKSPGFTAVALLSLAVGIGANTAVFSLVNAVVIRDQPYQAPERLVNIYRDRGRSLADPLNYPDFLEVQEATADLFSELGGFQYTLAQRELEQDVEPVLVEMVTGNYMPLLGLRPALGRTLLPEDHVAPGAHPVVVLGYRYWQTAFAGEPGVLGQEIVLSGRAFRVVGVAPEAFAGSLRVVAPDLFAPVMMVEEILPTGWDPLESRGSNSFYPVGRLRNEATLTTLRGALAHVADELTQTYPGAWNEGDSFRVVPTQDVIFNPDVDEAVTWVNAGALSLVGLVLLIACANLAGFLLARGVDRRKEVALRLSLGATRGRLIRQLLTETLALAVMGGVVAIPLALWILKLGLGTTLPFPLPIGLDVGLDYVVLAFTGVVTLATGLLVGLIPALQAARPELAPTLKDEGVGGQGSRALFLGRLLVTGQMAVSVILLVLAGLLARSFDATRRLNPGFGAEPTAVLTFLTPAEVGTEEERLELLTRVLDEARGLPGVSDVAAISNIHLNPLNSMFLEVNVEGVQPPDGRSGHLVDFTSVSPGFFGTAGIPLLEGRTFNDADRADGPPVVVINQAMAHRFWPRGNALGQTIDIAIPDWNDPTVVGVVGTAKIRNLREDPTPFMYLPFAQEYNAMASLLAVGPDPRGTAGRLFRLVRERHPQLIVSSSTTLQDHVGVMLIFSRLTALLSSVFAGLALGLAVIGLYGVVSYAVARRTREVGIRLSLGADPWGVLLLQLRDGMRLVLIGGALGLLLALGVGRVVSGFLVGVGGADPLAFGAAAAVLVLVTILATLLPARRASRINPVEALKRE